MKTNKKILTIFTLCIALLLTACSTTDTADTKENNASLTESDTTSDSSDTVLNDLYQQENQLFADQIVKLLMKRIHDKQLDMKPEGRLIKPYFYPSESCGMSNVRLNKLKFASDTFSTLELNWKLYNNKKQKEEKQ